MSRKYQRRNWLGPTLFALNKCPAFTLVLMTWETVAIFSWSVPKASNGAPMSFVVHCFWTKSWMSGSTSLTFGQWASKESLISRKTVNCIDFSSFKELASRPVSKAWMSLTGATSCHFSLPGIFPARIVSSNPFKHSVILLASSKAIFSSNAVLLSEVAWAHKVLDQRKEIALTFLEKQWGSEAVNSAATRPKNLGSMYGYGLWLTMTSTHHYLSLKHVKLSFSL